MDETKEFLKKYWPYVVGGLIGLYIVMKYMGGSSSSSSSDPYAAYLQAQTAASAQNAALGMQTQLQQAQINAQSTAAANQNAIANKTLDVQNNANYANAFNNFQTTQAQMATALGSSVSQVIGALNAPALTAMQSAAYENGMALQAAGNVAANSFMAQGAVSQGTSNMFSNAISSIGKLGQFPGSTQPTSGVSDVAGAVGRGVAAYYTMGGSEAVGAFNNSSSGGGSSSSGNPFGVAPTQNPTGYSNNLSTNGLGTYNPGNG